MSFDEPLASFALPYVVTRQSAAGSYVKGLWKNAADPTVLEDVMLVIQPATGRMVQQLPEGQREKETIVVFAADELVVSEQAAQKKGDRFSYGGRDWEVQKRSDWNPGSPLPHYEYLAQLVENDT